MTRDAGTSVHRTCRSNSGTKGKTIRTDIDELSAAHLPPPEDFSSGKTHPWQLLLPSQVPRGKRTTRSKHAGIELESSAHAGIAFAKL